MAKQLPKRDLENVGLGVTCACVALVTLVVAALIFMVAQKGLSAFVKDGVSVVEFFLPSLRSRSSLSLVPRSFSRLLSF